MTLAVRYSAIKTRIERLFDAVLKVRKGWIVGAVLLFIYGMYTELSSGNITNDEAWFLQVSRRLAEGEVLYKDIFFNVPPLSAYSTSLLIKIFGAELMVVKVLMSSYFTATGLLAIRILQKLRLGKPAKVLFILAYLAYTPSWLIAAGSLYTPLAYVLLLVTFLAMLSWLESELGALESPKWERYYRMLILGILSGLSFVTKQNIGAYIFLVVMFGVWVSMRFLHQKPRAFIVPCFLLLTGFISTLLLFLIPILLTGSLEKFLEFGFLNRANYIQAAQIPYTAQVSWFWQLLNNLRTWYDLLWSYWTTQLFLPPVTYVILFIIWIRSKSQRRHIATLLILFNTASFIGVFPRVALSSIIPSLPVTLISTIWGLSKIQSAIKTRLLHIAYTLCVLWLSLGIIAMIGRPIRWILRDTHQFSGIPQFRALFLPKDYLQNLESAADMIHTTAQDESVFFLTPSASVNYLLTGYPNLTPFDYPLLTAFGFDGQEQVIMQIQNGEIDWVCFTSLGEHPLNPRLLEEFVQTHMILVQNTGLCALYKEPDLD
jgi:hypothetical protein